MKKTHFENSRPFIRVLITSISIMMLINFFALPIMAESVKAKYEKTIIQTEKITINGIILDESGESIIGASILQVGTSNGITSDIDGHFTLQVPSNAKILVSFIGYVDQTIDVSGKTNFKIILKEDSRALDEVVVIGYGTTTKRKMVGSVSSIDAKELKKSSFNNVTEALQGKVSGLIVQNSGGAPGSTPSVSIRGGGTPLYVIDGVISSEYEFSVLNNNDIASISFLKDASATAVYGSKAGDGIILVQTKRGKKGEPVLRYSTSYQVSQPTFINKRVSSATYAEAANEVYMHDTGAPLYDDETMSKIINHTDLENYPDNDFVDLALKDFSPTTKHDISVSGGGDYVDYYLSLGYMNQDGIYKQNIDYLNRYTVRSNVTSHFDKIGLEVGLNVNASLQKVREPEQDEWSQLYFQTLPLQSAYNADGSYASGTLNPLPYLDSDAGYSLTRKKYVDTQLSAKWTPKFVKGLNFSVLGSYNDNDYFQKEWTDVAQQYYSDGTIYPKPFSPELSAKSGYGHTLDAQFKVNYDRTFGDHTINATLVYNRRNSSSQYVYGYRRDYLSSSVDQLNAGSSVGQIAQGTETESASEGYVFRAKYDYKSRYILEVSGRYDGNDNFAEGHKWGFFPAVSAVWIMSDEDFMQPFKQQHILDNLKIRTSYGETGISSGAGRFPYLSTYSMMNDANSYTVGGNLVSGFEEGNLVAADLISWYTRKSFNIGFDFASLNNRLEGSFDYFYYQTTGFLMSPKNTYSDPLGKDLPQINSNTEHRRAGYELVLNWKDNIGKFNYSIGGNISWYDQLYAVLDSEDESTLKNPYTRLTQQKDCFGIDDTSSSSAIYLSDGLFQSSEDIYNSPRPLASTDTQSGDIKYIDANGDGKIDDQDRRRVGKPTSSHINFGINFSLSYDAWFMNGLIQGTGKRYIYMGVGYARSAYQDLLVEQLYDYWTPTNTDAFFPRPSTTDIVNGGNNSLLSDYYVINGQYVRLKNLSIGYNFKQHLLKNLKGISELSLSLNATNLLTFSPTMDYFDPEAKTVNLDTGNWTRARTGANYPVQRTFSLSLNIAF